MLIASLLFSLTVQAGAQAWPPVLPDRLAPASRRPSYSAQELRAALLSPDGVEKVRALFEFAAESAVIFRFKVPVPRIAGEWAESKNISSLAVIPSIGGPFALNRGQLDFQRPNDPAIPVMWDLAANNEDPSRLTGIYSMHPAEMEIIDGGDSAHILRHALDNLSSVVPGPDREQRVARMFGRNVLTIIENASENYVRSLSEQGPVWHIHPPHFAADGWYVGPVPGDDEGGPTPSDFDRSSASERGENLTLVFQPDGFDAYDLPGGGKVEYRSEEWRSRFASIHAVLVRRLGELTPE